MASSAKAPRIEFHRNTNREKKASDWEKSVLGKIGSAVGKASAPMADIEETANWIKSKGKMKTGGPLGYTRKALKDLGWGQKTEDKIKKMNAPKSEGDPLLNIHMKGAIERRLKNKPVGGVGIRRKANDPAGKPVADF
jgi:hypothetical protein